MAGRAPGGEPPAGRALPCRKGASTGGNALPGGEHGGVTIDDSLKTPSVWLTEDEVPADWEVGDVLLDLYEVTGMLGEGGMGKVWRVHHRGWDLAMAVKNPRPELFRTEEGRATFVQEAQTWVNLALHPNTVSCYYVRSLGGIPRVFAECVEGGTVLDWVWYGRLYQGEPNQVMARVIDIAIQMAWGLHHAHQAGILHQDVKSSNIMVTDDGTAKVTDFGLAVAFQAAERYENPDDRIMTPEYASPEQAAGHPLTLKSDLFSWAVIVLEMIRRDQPEYGPESLAALKKYRELEAAGKTPTVYPPAVLQLLERCLQENPDRRPRDLAEVAAILTECYPAVSGRSYHRRMPVTADRQVDSLNNRAVSLCDLGKTEDAMRLLKEGLTLDPTHLHAVHNFSLLRWRLGHMSEDRMLTNMRDARAANPAGWEGHYLMAWVHLERGDQLMCRNAMAETERQGRGDEVVEKALNQIHSTLEYGSRLGRVLSGHMGDVYSVAMTPDGSMVVSGGADGCVRLWDPRTGVCIQNLVGHSSPVAGVCISADGRLVFSASADTTIRVWDLSNGQCLHVLAHGWSMRAVAASEDGTWLVAASMDKTLSLWHVPSGRRIRTLTGHTDGVLGVAMATDGSLCVSSSEDTTLRVWDLSTGDCMGILKGHAGKVNSVALGPEGRYCISGGVDHTVRLWDLERMDCVRTMVGHLGVVKGVALASDAGIALSAGATGDKIDGEVTRGVDLSVRVWELATGRCIGVLRDHRQSVMAVAVSADGMMAASASQDARVALWQIRPQTAPLALVQPRRSEQILEDQTRFKDAMAAAERAIKNANWHDAVVQLQTARALPGYSAAPQILAMWNDLHNRAERGELRGVRPTSVLKGHGGPVRKVFISADGRRVLSNSRDGTARLWEPVEEVLLRQFLCAHPSQPRVYGVIGQSVPPEGGYGLALSEDASILLTAGDDMAIKVWETANGRQVRSLAGHTDMINTLCITPDNRLAVSASADGTVRVWHLGTGKQLSMLQGNQGWAHWADVSPDGRMAVSSHTDGRLRVWDVAANRIMAQLEAADGVTTCVLFGRDGNTVVSGSLKKTIRVWDLSSGTSRVLTGHTGGVYGLALTADGRTLVSASDDHSLKLWDLASGKCIQTLDGSEGAVNACAISADGRFVVSAGEDQLVRVWQLDWNLVPRKNADYDDGVRRTLETFLTLHTRPGGFMRKPAPTWNDADLARLMVDLGYQGYGWLRTDGIQRKLKEMAASWAGQPPFGV